MSQDAAAADDSVHADGITPSCWHAHLTQYTQQARLPCTTKLMLIVDGYHLKQHPHQPMLDTVHIYRHGLHGNDEAPVSERSSSFADLRCGREDAVPHRRVGPYKRSPTQRLRSYSQGCQALNEHHLTTSRRTVNHRQHHIHRQHHQRHVPFRAMSRLWYDSSFSRYATSPSLLIH